MPILLHKDLRQLCGLLDAGVIGVILGLVEGTPVDDPVIESCRVGTRIEQSP